MFFKWQDQDRDKRIDRAGSELVRAAGLSEFDSDAVASSPFLYARIRARIAERQRAEKGVPALAMLPIAWRAVPALALVAIAALSALWMTAPAAPVAAKPASAQPDNIKLIATGGTCALSSSAECAISSEEVLATMFREEGKAER
jgi:hypothetical protein